MLDSRRVARRLLLLCVFACLLLPAVAIADERWTIGLSTSGAPIEAVVVAGRSASSPTVVLVGGLQRSDQSSDAVAREAAAFEQIPQNRRAFRLIAIARANPDAQPLQFPPSGVAYREHVESHVLWRWLGTHAPDLVLVAGPDPGLVDALSQNVVIDVGRIPARRVDASTRLLQSAHGRHHRLERAPGNRAPAGAIAAGARRGAGARLRTRVQTAELHRRDGRLSAGCASANETRSRALLAPYLDGAQDSFARPSQSSLASHLLFFEYARRTRDDRAKTLVLRAAASGFTENGELREFMPLHGGWSDSLFMDVPILAMAGALTGERRYFDMAARHVAFMQQIVLQAGRSLSPPGVRGRRMGARQCVPGARPGADPVGVPERACRLSASAGVVPHAHGGARALPGRERDVAQRHRSAWRLSGILRHRHDCRRRCCAASATGGSIARRTNR